MPQTAWEALLRHAVQGLCPPYTLETLRRWLQTTQARAWAIGAAKPPPQPTPAHREGKGQREGPQQGSRERPKVAGRRPQGQDTGGNATQGQGNTGKQGKGKTRSRGTGGEGTPTGARRHTKEGHTTPEGRPSPHPPNKSTRRDLQRRTPTKTRRRSPDQTPHEPRQVAPTDHRAPHRGRRVHPDGRKALQPHILEKFLEKILEKILEKNFQKTWKKFWKKVWKKFSKKFWKKFLKEIWKNPGTTLEKNKGKEPSRTARNPPAHPDRQGTSPATARATTQMQPRGHLRQKGIRPRHQGRGTTRRQRDRTGGEKTTTPDPTEHGTPLGARTPEDTGPRHSPQEGQPRRHAPDQPGQRAHQGPPQHRPNEPYNT